MKRSLLVLSLLLTTLLVQAQMSDIQVMQYVQRESKNGASQSQIATKLMQKGVTMQQLQRVRSQYEKMNGTSAVRSSGSTTDQLTADSRMRESNGAVRVDAEGNELYVQKVGTSTDADGETTSIENRQKIYIPDSVNTINGKRVFGRDIFNNKALSFEPNMNIATPTSYIVGPGDKVFVDVYGGSQKSEQMEVGPDGSIVVTGYGPIHIAGLSVSAANAKIKQTLGKRYSSSKIRMTLGQTRTIMVNVMGEVMAPGTYTLSAFASVFHALYMAGGVNSLGTLRDIKVFRGGRQIASVDIYDYILNGKLSGNIRLAENDVIMVGPYQNIVDVAGNVKRPMAYEMKKNESIATLLKYAGGFTGDAYKKAVRVNRTAGEQYSVYNVNEFDMSSFRLQDGDSVTVSGNLRRYENMVEIAGAVFRPGQYSLGGNVTTVKSLIEQADGLTEDAFAGRGVLHRMKEDRTRRVISLDIQGILNGTVADVPLENEDVLTIASKQEKTNERTITIFGEVMFPATYEYADDESIEDLIIQAGGLTDAASTVKVDVSRRMIDPKATEDSREVAQTFSFTLKDGLVVDGSKDFVLQPYDEVYVRKSPGYMPQRNVTVEGEVLFAGTYPLAHKNQRLSEVVKAAGGVTKEAYIRGARIERPMNADEKFRLNRILQLAKVQSGAGFDVNKVDQDSVYYVAIELDKALANPGSDDDVVLREGDRIIVPEFSGTVKIDGNVMYPNTASYSSGKSYKWYVKNQAGGFGMGAKKSRAFILYQNGAVKKASGAKIEPGCEIFVPSKTRSANDKISMIANLGTSLATMVTMLATVTNLIKTF
ncbi:protein involved in polysaccharide export, contains SLBB domain of the beta-grasp fold [Prevotella sp. khp1]|uniref:SLBB domain-containing protein n=1 Tax=Prevotellaceae TaxID=171552 RepID=UPI00088B989A|nr:MULTISPECIES: SLBB domain-containing protein [Prevotellaceae]QVJ81892.1 SLBB domain-containing protein [Xylanibacter ruminicola]SDQ77158.1 protein involved in polysaccharide export, contains SLBB domain of the beta-grasp fold [Prevotella sp. khp1]